MDNPNDFLPLSPHQFHILLALTDRERHGYAVIQDIEQRTDGAMRLGTGRSTPPSRAWSISASSRTPAAPTSGAVSIACCRSDGRCSEPRRRDSKRWCITRMTRGVRPSVAPALRRQS